MKNRKKILAAILAAAITMTSVTPAFAVETVRTEETGETAAPEYKEGWNTIGKKKYFVEKGKTEPKTGWLTYEKERYYLDPKDDGAMVTGLKTISKKQYYFASNGKLYKTRRFGYKIKNKYYDVTTKGVLTPLSAVEGLAGVQLDKLKGDTYAAFKWVSGFRYKNVKLPSGKKAPEYYGEYGFKNKTGDCNVQAYTFYWLAKRRGYAAKYVKGFVPQAVDKNGKPTKFGAHAWVELKIDGKTYVCDPSLAQTVYLKGGKAPKPAYRFQYGAKGTYKYYDANKKLITRK